MRGFIPLCLLLFTLPAFAQNQPAPLTALTGHWRGEGDIIVTWSQQKQLPIDLVIDAQSNVTGTIGDAQLRGGRLTIRTRLMRKLGNKDYLIQAKLDGPLIAAEDIRRQKIWLMVDLKEQRLEGSLNTSGSHFGGKKRMYLSVRRITLQRASE